MLNHRIEEAAGIFTGSSGLLQHNIGLAQLCSTFGHKASNVHTPRGGRLYIGGQHGSQGQHTFENQPGIPAPLGSQVCQCWLGYNDPLSSADVERRGVVQTGAGWQDLVSRRGWDKEGSAEIGAQKL